MRLLNSRTTVAGAGLVAAVASLAVVPPAGAVAHRNAPSFLGSLHTNSKVASTVPANGDVNPYGVAVVARSVGRLRQGDVLVSNFNAKSNLQGTGRTIVAIGPGGRRRLFASIRRSSLPGRCPGGVGLTTALGVTSTGWVIVGSLPTKDGSASTAKAGCLIVLDSMGHVRETLSGHGINGPWDMALVQHRRHVTLFVTNVLNGTVAANGAVVHRGTVLRLRLLLRGTRTPRWVGTRVIGRGFPEHSDPAALVVGPTGVALGPRGGLYVADTAANRLARIPHAMTRMTASVRGATVTTGGALNAPLGLVLAPNMHLVAANAGNGNLVETTRGGHHVTTKTVDTSGSPPGAGALFGLAVRSAHGLYFVDDATNTLQLLH